MAQHVDLASLFGRHEFFFRRWHSFTGVIPVGGFLVFHLATNASIADGVEIFQFRVGMIHRLGPTTIMLLEWPFIFLPIIFHAVVGMMIVSRGKRNLSRYPYMGNWRYSLQRWTGVIAFFFIFWHVFHMHGWFKFEWWLKHVAEPLGGHRFDPADAYTAAQAIQSSIIVQAIYVIGVASCVYHFVNGLWTFGITWGIWTGPRAQRAANIPVGIIGVAMAAIGIAALVGMFVAEPPSRSPAAQEQVGDELFPPLGAAPAPTGDTSFAMGEHEPGSDLEGRAAAIHENNARDAARLR
ncbi:hypothetical protein JCM19992_24910 [Thermostilla marina]